MQAVSHAHHLLDDHDMVYTTTKSADRFASLPKLPSAVTAFTPTTPAGELKDASEVVPPKRFEFTRRGQRCGDVGWGCFVVDPQNTGTNGRLE